MAKQVGMVKLHYRAIQFIYRLAALGNKRGGGDCNPLNPTPAFGVPENEDTVINSSKHMHV